MSAHREPDFAVARLIAVALGGLEVAFLFVLGASIPADDIIWGNAGQWFICAGLVLGSLVFVAWLFPRGGGLMLALVGGLLMLLGFSLTFQAGLVFGVAPLVSGLLFTRATPPADGDGSLSPPKRDVGSDRADMHECAGVLLDQVTDVMLPPRCPQSSNGFEIASRAN